MFTTIKKFLIKSGDNKIMSYKLKYFNKTRTIRNGIYLNIEDLIAAMFNEMIEYKYYCSTVSTPLNFENFLKENQKQIENLINNAENDYIDLGYCRISLIKED